MTVTIIPPANLTEVVRYLLNLWRDYLTDLVASTPESSERDDRLHKRENGWKQFCWPLLCEKFIPFYVNWRFETLPASVPIKPAISVITFIAVARVGQGLSMKKVALWLCTYRRKKSKWTLWDLNPRPHAHHQYSECEACALPLCQEPIETQLAESFKSTCDNSAKLLSSCNYAGLRFLKWIE